MKVASGNGLSKIQILVLNRLESSEATAQGLTHGSVVPWRQESLEGLRLVPWQIC